ncbi:MAG: lipoate--protein ligase [Clostridia bacterium]|nr:lipoate--protein ligase [Clostridia bacterium]
MQPLFYECTSENPCETLALEEALLERPAADVFLLLYRHQPSVIIGRTQNAWAECRTERLKEDGVQLARRISGGGAVYHDPGNLNFSFLMHPDAYDTERQLSVILQTVRSFGIEARFSGRNDLLADGRKFSGSAFCVRNQACCHHGTLLIGTDMQKMADYLHAPQDKLAAKGVASVPARVINLGDLCPGLTVDRMRGALLEEFAAEYGRPAGWEPDADRLARARELAARNAAWGWRYGKTPPFDLTLRRRFRWGSLELNLSLERGCIKTAHAWSDAMDPDLILALAPALQGCPLTGAAMSAALKKLGPHPLLADIRQFLASSSY